MLALPDDVRAKYDVSSLKLVSQTGSACPPDTKLAMIEWFGPIFVESYGGSESGTLCRIDSTRVARRTEARSAVRARRSRSR